MMPRAAYQLQILEKVAAPLLAATEARQPGDVRAEAAIVAELLARSVQSGLMLAQVMDVREQGADGESIRLALSALAASVVAGLYRHNGQVPQEADMQRQVTALSAALTFADNFSPVAENTDRLAALGAGDAPAALIDETQAMIQCLQALTPVVAAVAGYSFGRPEKKMMQDVTARLVQQAGNMAQRLLPGATPSESKRAELGFLRALAPLYCEAHRAETARVMALDDNTRLQVAPGGILPLDPLWQDFDRHAALLDVLGQMLLRQFAVQGGSQSGDRAPAPQVTVIPQILPQPPVTPPSAAQPPEASAPYNPMAFFKPGQVKAEDTDNT